MTKSIVFTRMTATEGESSEPLGICYIASYLREKGFDVNIVDREKNIVEKIKKLNPDFVGISSTTLSYWKAIEIAKELKIELPDTKIIIGGNHITALPMKMPDCFDIGVVGEGEITTLEILQGKDINKIKGIVFRKNNNLVMTGPRPLIENLDILPFPARDLLPMKFYLEPKKMSGRIAKVLYVMTSRGCPYDCKFCSSADMWHSKVRYFSVEYVKKEINYILNNYGVEEIQFPDDIFSIDMKRLRSFAEVLPKDVSYWCYARANMMNDERCELFKKMNIKEVGIGLESGSEKILNFLKCNTVTVKDNVNAIELCKKHGIELQGCLIIGSPTETKEDMLQTLDMAKMDGITRFGVSILTPMPGTQLWNYAKEKQIVNDNIDWKEFSENNKYNAFTSNTKFGYFVSIPQVEFEEILEQFNDLANKKNFSVKFSFDKLLSLKTWNKIIKHPNTAVKILKNKLAK